MSSVENYFYTHLYILCTSVIVVMNVNANLILFILQVQASSSVEAASQSAGEIPFTEATERIKVCKENTWSFSDVVYHPKVLCEPH